MSRAGNLLTSVQEEHSNAVLQYELPEAEAKQILNLRKLFSPEDLDPEEDNQDLPPHITVFYGLKDEDLSDVQECLKNFGRAGYTIQPKPIIFDNQKHDVLVLPVQSQCFSDIHKHVGNWCNRVPPTFREYKPHCTISYLKKGTPYDHVRLPNYIVGNTDELQFSDTKDKPHTIRLR